ncbi:MAG: hypothetical protein IJK84_06390 [Bacteroidales bacterium]|nr:hypothetical protein [Bacteroidales bacterium]
MKRPKTLWAISLLTIACLMGCQNDYQKYLSLMIEGLNKECPIPLGALGHMDKAQYNGHTVTFHYTITGLFDTTTFRQNREQFHQYMLDNYRSNSDESFRQLLNAIVNAQADLDVVFSIPEGDTSTLHFTCQELADNMPSYIGDPETYLQSTLQSSQLQLPHTYAEGMVCTRIELDSTYFTYYFECDENLFDISEMQFSATTNHDAVRSMLTASSDPSFVKMMAMLKQTNRGLRYFYTGTTSGKEAIVSIPPEEL